LVLHYHLDTINVVKGQKVTSETILGNTGTTGQSTGIHLHYGWFKIGEWTKPFNQRKWEDFEKYEYVPASTTLKYKIGDKVKILSKGSGSSDGKAGDAFGIGWERFVLKTFANRPFPYQLGNFEGTTGFYKEESLEPITTSQTINEGDTVVVNGYGTSSSDGTGTKTKEYKNHKMKVIAILKSSKNQFLLNQNNEGTVRKFKDGTAWFNKDSLRK
jgi:hypothetical protein